MLVLSRKKHESIQIGDYVVTVTWIGRDRVKLGITAPKDVKVLREEVQRHTKEDDQ